MNLQCENILDCQDVCFQDFNPRFLRDRYIKIQCILTLIYIDQDVL